MLGVVDLTDQSSGALVDEGLKFDFGDEREGEVEEVPVARADGGEESVEEDRVKDA